MRHLPPRNGQRIWRAQALIAECADGETVVVTRENMLAGEDAALHEAADSAATLTLFDPDTGVETSRAQFAGTQGKRAWRVHVEG